MFRRKLQALDYHTPTDNFSDEAPFRNLIVWLEDQKIRHYTIEDRVALRQVSDAKWPDAFRKYLSDVACPLEHIDRNGVIDWLLGFAIRLEYGDNVDKYRSVCASKTSAPNSSNPLDSLDFATEGSAELRNVYPALGLESFFLGHEFWHQVESGYAIQVVSVNDPDFKAGVASLAQLLNIPPHQDHLVVLKAICLLVKDKLSKEALEKLQKQEGTKPLPVLPLEKMELGFETPDENVSIMSLNDITLSKQPLSILSSCNADKRPSVIVLRNLFLTNAILLNERSPEQFEIIKRKMLRFNYARRGEEFYACYTYANCVNCRHKQMKPLSLFKD